MTPSSEPWRPFPPLISRSAEYIDLWRVRLGTLGSHEHFRSILDPQELERANRFRFPHLRDNFVLSHVALRKILARYLEIPPQDVRFDLGKHGKPEIRGSLNYGRVQFNLSHSGDWAVVAITQGREVGVDIETFRSDVNHLELARNYFSERECQSLLALPADKQARAFFVCWTQKEAFLKALGDGLSYPLSQFSVTVSPDEASGLQHVDNDPTAVSRWNFASFQPDGNHYGTVVYEKGHCELNQWDWRWDYELEENAVRVEGFRAAEKK